MATDKKKDTKGEIVRDTAKFSGGHYLSQAVGVFTAVFLRRFLGPYNMGVWSLFRVLQSYSAYLLLGVGSSAAYKIPYYKSKGDATLTQDTVDTTFGFMLAVSMLTSLCLIAVAVWFRSSYPVEVIVGLVVFAVYILLSRIYGVYVVVLRAYKNITVLTRSVVFDSVFNLILVSVLVRKYQLYGMFVAVAVLAIANTLFIHFQAKYRIEFRIIPERMKELVVCGVPLLLCSFMGGILRSIDKIMIVKMMGVLYVGFYSVANMTANYVHSFSNNLGIVTIPHMQERFGKEGKVDDVKKFVTVSAEVIGYLLAPILGFICLASPLLVKNILPQYVPGILAMQILLLESFFRSSSLQANQFIVTLGKQRNLLPIFALTIVFNVVFNYFFIKSGFGIAGAAMGTSLAAFLNFTAVMTYAMKHFMSFKDIFKFIVRLLLPLLYVLLVILAAGRSFAGMNQYIKFSLDAIILAIASLPLLLYINKKHSLSALFFKKIRG